MGSDKLDLQDKLIAFKSILTVIGAPVATALTGDPFVATGVTNLFLETFFGIQSEVKMKRVSSFLEKLEEGIREIEPEFDLENTQRIELRDLIETAIIKASRANSENKIERLKKILIGQIKEPEEYDYVSRYLDLASLLNDNQVLILSSFVNTEVEFVAHQDALRELNKELEENRLKKGELSGNHVSVDLLNKLANEKEEISSRIREKQKDFNRVYQKRKHQLEILGKEEYNFLLNELRVFGLIYNPYEGMFGNEGEYADYRCTILAKGFMKYLTM
ncbi:hypothetical protein PP182_11030 [Maribacter sp. PR1]|uniref:Uncharacterized protein n=1 Tax=Maribacter cobaltidurans TaxID=1178778 RepID=A0ABU7IUU1_9FLAO|nr:MULTISPECIES: hypothetical protein [Maribacter]MDC6389216.1 hypothetical protein [Maribacter sp. PR1]MEE1976603.1 hypothetical protein [Maribacter cobaltidurans]